MKYLFPILLILPFISCVKDKVDDPFIDNSLEYFPLIDGKYITYAVDSIVFDDNPVGNKKDTVHFQLREQIAGYQIYSGDTVYYINRYRKNEGDVNWLQTDVWTAQRSETEALKTEENLTFRKMSFPLRDGKRWVATSYIHPLTTVLIGTENVQAFQEWQSTVLSFDIADQIGDFTFSEGNITHIEQTNTDDDITKRFVLEKYARHIGMVERIDTILDSRCIVIGDFTTCIGKPWMEHAGKGYILSQIMIDHN